MNIEKSFRRALDIVQLKEAAMLEVAADPEATQVAWAVVVIASLAASLGSLFFPVRIGMVVYRPDLFWILRQTIFDSVGMLAGLYFGGYAAEKWFHSKLSMVGFVRVMGHAAILGLVSLIPILNILCLWELVVWWHVCTRMGKMQMEATALFLVLLLIFAGLLGSLAY